MKKKLYISWFCAECRKSGIAEVELPTNVWSMMDAMDNQHRNCNEPVEIRNVEVAVK